MPSEKTIFDRLSEYIDYAEATNKFADVAFYKELYMLLGTSHTEAELQAKLLAQREACAEAVGNLCLPSWEEKEQAILNATIEEG